MRYHDFTVEKNVPLSPIPCLDSFVNSTNPDFPRGKIRPTGQLMASGHIRRPAANERRQKKFKCHYTILAA